MTDTEGEMQQHLAEVLTECSKQFRKGDEHTSKTTASGYEVHDVYFMDHVSTADPDLVMVDVWFINVGVDKDKAESRRAEIIELINSVCDVDRMHSGPSYIEIGGYLGSQDLALMLMAVGHVLGFWEIILPNIFLLINDEAKANELAGAGFLFIDGYKTSQEESLS